MASLCCIITYENSWGDGGLRTYQYTCLIRAVTSEDGMTADYYNFSKEFLDKISTKINNVKGVNRVIYDINKTTKHY